MAALFHKDDKYREFYKTCELIRASTSIYLTTREIAVLAANSPCSSFFMSVEHICRIIWEMNTDRYKPSKSPVNRKKHSDIYARYKDLLVEHGDKPRSLNWYARQISEQRAPSFYLSDDYSAVLYYRLINNRHDL